MSYSSTLTPEAYRSLTANFQTSYYPSPFFDTASIYIPTNIKDIFKWSRFYYYTHPVVNRVIATLTEYPITDFEPITSDVGMRQQYIKMLDALKLRSFLVEYGMDYYAYGNCFVSIYFPFIRMLVCPLCKQGANIRNTSYKIKSFSPYGKCPQCGQTVHFKMEDITVRDYSKVRLIRWDPLNIHIEHNPVSGESDYYLSIPSGVRKGIMSGQPIFWNSTPIQFIETVKKKEWLKFLDGQIFHFKRPSLADYNSEWGKPMILPVLREIYHLYTLRRAQEAIAIDKIIPLRYLYPMAQSANIDPIYNVDLGEWRGKLEEEIRKWRVNPLYKPIFPIPVGEGTIGGDGKALMVFPEMEATSSMIENGLGMPSGFMSGQLTYSGGNVALRVLENSIITYRNMLEEFACWVVGKISNYMGMPEVEVRMKEFKMADDMSRKGILANLNAAGKVSDETLLSEMDISLEHETGQITKEKINAHRDQLKVQLDVAETLQGFVGELNSLNELAKNNVVARMSQEMPETYNLIADRITPTAQMAQMAQIPSVGNNGSDMNNVRPPNSKTGTTPI